MAEQVVYIDAGVFKKHPKNNDYYDDISGEEYDTLKQSIAEDGLIHPLIVTKDWLIISGHQRFQACVELDYEKIPCIIRDDLTDEKDVERLLIASNFGRGEKSGPKFRKAIAAYVKLCGVKRGGDRKSKPQIAGLKTRKEIAKELGMSEDTLDRLMLIESQLTTEMKRLYDEKKISQAIALQACNLSPEEQKKILTAIAPNDPDGALGEQLKKEIKERVKMKKEFDTRERDYKHQVDKQSKRIEELESKEPVEVEAPPADYAETKQSNVSLQKRIADLEAQLEAASKTATVNLNNNTSAEDNSKSILVLFIPDRLPSITEIAPMDEIEGLLRNNPDERILSEIYAGNTYKCVCYQILEQALGLTDENNKLQVSYGDYSTQIRKYDGTNYEKLAEKIQKNISKTFK